ncbi:glycoside hydrolase family 17 protein [Myriangium duriaei CBS 260.36]|uniref:Probable glucan endo-1,3-beta-glucosidase eglC n=1 Tax=Myriangium duriaei CBS 260.36 TaxID=1168546 RepID=A0A9P4MMR2_9PEZI|nr:glycoside hydrolase family 17 protein [Myriangium duriaei CBS 260.36]
MKLSVASSLALAAPALAALRGFNSAATNPDGSCKSVSDWQNTFSRIQAAPGSFKTVRVYAASDCNTLANAVPAAINTKTKLIVGIWTEDETHYGNEKQALLNVMSTFGHDWIQAITVGSEDLYRGDTSASALAAQIYDVRGMVRAQGVKAPVGHVDTWTAWVNPGNNDVIKAADFVGMDAYPYFQAIPIDNAVNVFMQNLTATRNYVHSVKSKVPLWITETGWPVHGATYGGVSVASPANARRYWRGLMCSNLLKDVNVFWYMDEDYWMKPSFGMIGKDGKRVYDQSKC